MTLCHVRDGIEEISIPQQSVKKIRDRESICSKVNNWIKEGTPLLCRFHLHADLFYHSSGYDFEVIEMKVRDGHGEIDVGNERDCKTDRENDQRFGQGNADVSVFSFL